MKNRGLGYVLAGAMALLVAVAPQTQYVKAAESADVIVRYDEGIGVSQTVQNLKLDQEIEAADDEWNIGGLTFGEVTSDTMSDQELIAYLEKMPGVSSVEANQTYTLLDDNQSVAADALIPSVTFAPTPTATPLPGVTAAPTTTAVPGMTVPIPTITNDSYYGLQWWLKNTGQYGGVSGSAISAPALWDAGYTGGDVVVAVVDSGVDYTHEDLTANMWVNTIPGLDGTYGYDFGENDSDPMDEDADGHGTHVAGTIAATRNNELGIAGTAPGAKIMALKVFYKNYSGDYLTDTAKILSAYDYIYKAMQAGVKVKAINLSVGANSTTANNVSSSLTAAVKKVGALGAVSIFAAGNDGASISRNYFFADTNNDYCITGGACDDKDQSSVFSNYDATAVDIAAPGEKILATVNENVFLPGIMSKADRTTYCSQYTDFSSSTDAQKVVLQKVTGTTSTDFTVESSYEPTVTFQGMTGGCLKLTLTNQSYLPYKTGMYYEMPQQTGTYQVGLMIKEVSPEESAWESFGIDADSFSTINGKSYLGLLSLSVPAQSTRVYYIDDLGISKANTSLTSFGKYNYMQGTSMAAPVVSGAVALLASQAPTFTAAQLRKYLLLSYRYAVGVSGKVKTGVLDLSNYQTNYTTIKKTSTTSGSSSTKTVKVGKAKFSKIKRYKKHTLYLKFTAKNAKKYQVQVATKKNFKKKKTAKLSQKWTYLKMKKKGTVYLRVRGLRGSKKGKWSSVKKVKVK